MNQRVPILVLVDIGRVSREVGDRGRPLSGNIMRLSVRRSEQRSLQSPAVSQCIEQYYLRQVATEHERVRFAQPASTALISGIRLAAFERVALRTADA